MEFLSIKRLHNRSRYAHARTLVIATVAEEFHRLDHEQLAEIFHRDPGSIYYSLKRHAMLLASVPAYQQLHASVQKALAQAPSIQNQNS